MQKFTKIRKITRKIGEKTGVDYGMIMERGLNKGLWPRYIPLITINNNKFITKQDMSSHIHWNHTFTIYG